MSIDPTEYTRIVLWCTALRNAMRPIFGEAMLACRCFQSGRTNANTHHDIRFIVLGVVTPERGQWFLHTIVTWKNVRKCMFLIDRRLWWHLKSFVFILEEENGGVGISGHNIENGAKLITAQSRGHEPFPLACIG